MTHNWSPTRLKEFATADDMHVSPFYADGKTYGTPTWIWSVVVAKNLYVRAWNGPNSSWYRSAITQNAGRIHLAGQNFKVYFEPVSDLKTLVQVNMGYQQKYHNSPYLPPMLTDRPISATVRILPR